MSAPVKSSLYRCADCGHGKHLTAWAIIVAHGPLGDDGILAGVDWDEDDTLFEDSIACLEHPEAIIERFADGAWCRSWACLQCGGEPRAAWNKCDVPSPDALKGAHHGWCPVSQIPALEWYGLGVGHILDQDLRYYRAGRSPHPFCRICGAHAESIAGREPCRGDDHQCPAVIVAQADSPCAIRVYGREDWLCGRPGGMNDDFTAWTCTAGHVCGPGHASGAARHDRCIPRGCPWLHLAPVRASVGTK